MAIEIPLSKTAKSYRSKSYIRAQVTTHWPNDVTYMIVKNEAHRYQIIVTDSGAVGPATFVHNNHMVVG